LKEGRPSADIVDQVAVVTGGINVYPREIEATLAELELELGRERRAASCESRRARQLPPTKPQKLTADRQEQLRRLAEMGEPVRELAAAFGIGRATAYRYLSQERCQTMRTEITVAVIAAVGVVSAQVTAEKEAAIRGGRRSKIA
jgi:hypothetical protein